MSPTTAKNEPIAVVGSGCRFPGGASTPSKLWSLLSRPRDVLSEIPHSRFNPRGFYHPDGEHSGHSNVQHSYLLDEDHRAWDADFFGISANEASAIDPQQRLLMETVYEALEAGGHPVRHLHGSDTAVYVGLMCEEYSGIQTRELNTIPTYFPTGTARSIVSNRISYFFDWHGPSMTIDTACSSSLVAVHQATQVLRSGASRMAIAAGANLILGPEPYISESTFHMLSPRGRSRMWDAGADGYGRGDGVAAVVLKRLSDAIADGDAIECVIRETGVNQDGRTTGITVPSADAQVALINDTYRRAGLDLQDPSDQPQFFEAHGTGTKAGDPIEAEAIYHAIGRHIHEGGEPLFSGSIKTVIGHTEGSAGLAGLLKVSLALQHGIIPPNMLFNQLNPAIKPFYGKIIIPVQASSWPATGSRPRRASVNSFGFGGTNAHAIVESYQPKSKPKAPEESTKVSCWVPYTFSASSKASLKRMLENIVAYIEVSPNIAAHDLAFTLNTRRSLLPFRAAYAGCSIEALKGKIQGSVTAPDWEPNAVTVRRQTNEPVQILGIFTGQGAQWVGMGKQLFQDLPFAQARLLELETALATLPAADRPSWSLRAELLETDAAQSKVHLAEYAQPLCTALQIVLVDLLAAANVCFSAVVGHSSGEIAAAYASGVLSAGDAIIVAYYRGLCSTLAKGESGQKGAMIAVGTTMEDGEEIASLPQFEGRLCVAAYNSPESITMSGDQDAVEEAKTIFEEEGKFVRLLRVDTAYHSHHMQPCTVPYIDSLQKASVQATKPRKGCKWYSSVSGGVLSSATPEEEINAAYWARNMAQTVCFSTAVENAVRSHPFAGAIEIGPHGALRGPVKDTIVAMGKSVPAYFSCLSRNQDSNEHFSNALGQIWAHTPEGAMDLEKFQIAAHGLTGTRPTLLTNLPAYPWDNRRIFWHESRRSRALRLRSEPGHPLLGTLTPESTDTDMMWHNVLRISDLPWLKGHKLQNQTVFPAAGYVALAVEASVHLAKSMASFPSQLELQDLVISRAITFEGERAAVEILSSLHIENTREEKYTRVVVASFHSRSVVGDAVDAGLNASGRIVVTLGKDTDGTVGPQYDLPSQDDPPSLMVNVDDNDFYSALESLGYQYSMSFKALKSMSRKMNYGRSRLAKPSRPDMHLSEEQLLIHPGLLDAAFQAIFLAYSWPGDNRLWSLHIPVSIGRIRIDASRFRANNDGDLSLDAAITMDGSVTGQPGIAGDLNIFSGDGKHGLIQVEGIRIIPFAAASQSQDVQMFFTNIPGVAFPDGELAMRGGLNRAMPEEIELGWLLERISHFYLARLTKEITPAEEARAEWHHQKLMNFARHTTKMVREGRQPYGKQEWVHDDIECLQALMDANNAKIEVRLMRSVGEHLAQAVRGDTVILEHMLQDGMLNQYYVESLGLQPYTVFLTEIIGQITHVNPHMRVLEIGAGTGGATKSIMKRIRDAFDQYTFTDISPGFFETAQGVFADFSVSGRMSFQVLDAEKDVLAQGFERESFDLVIASLVLHATKDLGSTLRNVRQLLRPGGFLVMLEVTSNVTMRLSFTMGGLEGWWLGAETGRPWTPCVSAAEWHNLLLQSGYSGVETSTPELDTLPRPFGVLVSRAVNERVNLLLSPSLRSSPPATIPELLVVTGRSLRSVRLAQAIGRIIKPYCQLMKSVDAVEELLHMEMSTRLTVLYLGDLHRPVFEKLMPEAFEGLKQLFSHAQNVLWVTCGARQDRPYANMSKGLGRAMLMEQSHMRIQFIDFNVDTQPSAHMLADDLLRLQTFAGQEQDSSFLWSFEPEINVDAQGRRWVDRILPHQRFNACYNAPRRTIISHVDPADTVVEVQGEAKEDEVPRLVSVQVPEAVDAEFEGTDIVRVRVLYSAPQPLRHASTQALYACMGINTTTKVPVIALHHKLGSTVDVPASSMVAYNHPLDEAPARLMVVATELLASLICSEVETSMATLLVEPNETLARIVTRWEADKGVSMVCVTSVAAKVSPSFTFIHTYASIRAIQRALPSNIGQMIFFGDGTATGTKLGRRLKACMTGPVRVEHADSFRARDSSSIPLTSLLREIVDCPRESVAEVDVVHVQDYVERRRDHNSSVIVDWASKDVIQLTVQPSDSLPLLRGDRTYILFGLAGAGGLGLSLAEYLAGQGARHIILTSRKPNVDQKLISTHAAQGVRIQMMANDITDEVAVNKLVADVRSSSTWPPVAGVANGAMILNDITLQNMSYDQMMRVLRPKVEGTRILDQIFRDDPLDFFVLFSSLSCVFGREGQANYDAANMYLVGTAAQRRARGVCASVIDIGAVMGTGYMAREVSEQTLAQLLGAGYRKMSERDFHIAFANGILTGRSGMTNADESELITGLYVAAPGEDFQPTWAKNPRFAHVMTRSGGAVDELGAAGSKVEWTRDLLQRARTRNDIGRVLQAAFLDKLQNVLQLSEGATDKTLLLQQSTAALGVDSLVAVEIRSWMLSQLDVDIPVLKILSDATIQELVDLAVQNLPEALAPNLDPNAADAITVEGLTRPAATPKSKAVPASSVQVGPMPDLTTSHVPPTTSRDTNSDSSSTTDSSQRPATSLESSETSSVTSSHETNALSSPVEKVFPMSFGQSRFWLMSQIVPNPCAFNVTCDIEIMAELDTLALAKAVRALSARHEALRTCFFNDTGDQNQPVQGILKESSLHLETFTAPTSEMPKHFAELHKTVYQFGKGELMRIVLVSSSPTNHHLLVGYHHINMDSSSLAVLVGDLQRLYFGQKPSAPRIQSPDFALWQIEQLRNGQWEKEVSYWREEFSTPPQPLPVLNLSPNKKRPDMIAYEIHSTKTRVMAPIARQIKAFCRNARVTPFHIYATVWQILLARLAATDDICIGMADANRTDFGASESIGNFLNLLPLRLKTALDQPFESLVQATKNKALHAMSNSAVPFDVILEQVQPQRSPSHSPIFQAFIDYRQVTERLPWGKGHVEGKEYLLSKTPYDVMLDIIDTPSGEASLEIMVQEGLYTAEEAKRLLSCFTNLLKAFTENSRLTAGEVNMFNADEVAYALRCGKGEMLEVGNSTVLPDIDKTAKNQPDFTALEDSAGSSLSWSEMVAKSVAVGQALAKLKMPSRSRVGLFQEPTVDWVYSILGIWRAGHAYVPLDPSQGMRRLSQIAKVADLAAVLVHDATVPLVLQLELGDEVAINRVSELSSTPELRVSSFPTVKPEDEAMVIYTSGSTGIPKGITIPHRLVVNAMRAMLHRWPMGPQTVLQQIAMSFDMSWWGALLGLATGGKVVVAGREARGDPRVLTNLIVRKGVTLTVAVPSESVAWLQNTDTAALRASSWAWHVAAGEPFSFGLVKHLQMLNRPSLRVINAYGPTETMIPTTHEVLYQEASADAMPVPIGRIMPNYSVRVVDPQGHPVPAGIPGQLVFGGAGIAHGYVGNPSLTAQRFPEDDLVDPSYRAQGWKQVHLSGDRGYLQESDGVLMLQARIDGDTQVKVRGVRVDVSEIEVSLISTAQGRISEAVVHLRKPVEDDPSSHLLTAHVVLTKEARAKYPTTKERSNYLRQVVKGLPLPSYMRPAVTVAVEALPLTHHGKMDRKAVATWPLTDSIGSLTNTRILRPDSGASGVVESSEDIMRELWATILGESARSQVIDSDSDFFLVGGNSLLLIRVQGELKNRHGIDVRLADLFQRSTLAQMASLLDVEDRNEIQPRVGGNIDWAEETKLQPGLAKLRATARPQPVDGLVVALTGASGFLGGHILDQLVTMPGLERVHCIAVRNPTGVANTATSKFVVHPGDLSLPNLGMTDDALQEVFSSAHVVIHNGADTSFLKAYSTVRATNVTSTKNIVWHALRYGQVRHLHYVSTAGISTLMSRDLYEEPVGAMPPDTATEGYVLSKWVSELYLEHANASTSLPITIHRPTAIVGAGAPVLDVISNLLHFSQKMHKVPSMTAVDGMFQFVEVEDVARDIISEAVQVTGDGGLDKISKTASSSRLLHFRNHCGDSEDAVDVHELNLFLGRKFSSPPLPVLPDSEWIAEAEAYGMPPEVARYLQGMNLVERRGQKWIFPMVWKRGSPP